MNSQLRNYTAFLSRDSLGVYHAILRLLSRFETFWGEPGQGEPRELVAAAGTYVRKSRDTCKKTSKARQVGLTGLG